LSVHLAIWDSQDTADRVDHRRAHGGSTEPVPPTWMAVVLTRGLGKRLVLLRSWVRKRAGVEGHVVEHNRAGVDKSAAARDVAEDRVADDDPGDR